MWFTSFKNKRDFRRKISKIIDSFICVIRKRKYIDYALALIKVINIVSVSKTD